MARFVSSPSQARPRAWFVALLTLATAAGTWGLTAMSASPAGAAVVSVRVSGNQLVDATGAPIHLVGVDRSGAEYACVQGWGIFDGPNVTDDTATAPVVATWKANAVRMPLNEDCWLGINGVNAAYSGANYQNAIKNAVNAYHAAGMAVILDLHWNAAGTTPATSQQDMPDADHAPAFWSSVATAFKADPGVVFDLYNEPHGVTWSCWKNGGCTTGTANGSTQSFTATGMQPLVTTVRNTGATNVVMVGGLQWANDMTQWLANKPNDPAGQLAASLHMYNFNACNNATCWNNQIAPVAAQVPVVTGEVGEDDCTANFLNTFVAWADSKNVSYTGWTWDVWKGSECTGPTLITGYDGTPTAMGAGLRDHLLTVGTPITTTTMAPTTTTTAAPTTTTTAATVAVVTTTTTPAPTTTTTVVAPTTTTTIKRRKHN